MLRVGYHQWTPAARSYAVSVPAGSQHVSTVGWEPGTHPKSIEKIRFFARDQRGFVAAFVLMDSPQNLIASLSEFLQSNSAAELPCIRSVDNDVIRQRLVHVPD